MGTLRFICLSLVFCSGALASETEISTILQKPGQLIFLKSEFVPSHLNDGTPSYYEMVVYDGELHRVGSTYNPDEHLRQNKLSCLAEYSTAIIDSKQQLIPTDADIKPGASFAWVTNPGVFTPAYSYEVFSDNRYVEHFRLYFFKTTTLTQISCSVSHKNPFERATVADFEETTGGRMTLGN